MDLLQNPVYVFQIPLAILSTLEIRSTAASEISDLTTLNDNTQTIVEPRTGGLSCGTCDIKIFENITAQREHVQSDYHMFNLKRRAAGRPSVDFAEFEQLLEGLSESISGSESTSSSISSGERGLSHLLGKNATIKENPGESANTHSPARSKGPIIWLTCSNLQPNTNIGVYRAILPVTNSPDELTAIKAAQIMPESPSRHVAMFMVGGGHFAALIVNVKPEFVKGASGAQERQVDILSSKTFHRYTTRRKQGGGQAAHDSAKGAAHSAGSSLRRYNEVALANDIRSLLVTWKKALDSADVILIRATGRSSRDALFGGENPMLRASDPRVRGFPFSTRRATQKELLRCFQELSRLKISHIDEAAIRASTAAPKQPKQPPIPTPALSPEESKALEAEQLLQMHTSTLASLVKRSKVPALKAYIDAHELDVNFPLSPTSSFTATSTLLHLASSLSLPLVVTGLLDIGADPTILNAGGRTPFEIAGDKAVRYAFRVGRHELGEARWDWKAARVGQAMSRLDLEQLQREEAEEARRAAEIQRIKLAEEIAKQNPAPLSEDKNLSFGSIFGSRPLTQAKADSGMTPALRMKIERERRARAAEMRLRPG